MPELPQKKVPIRQCVGCRERRPKRELVRVVRSPEGEVSLDLRGKANGRGAYICRNPECLKKALRSRALERAFEAAVPGEVAQALLQEMESADGA
ncbi:MAG: YlxR family protein [Oscillospiraceae bacterium]|nr:YlxR family protein [Oscillospiraceae bacterium]